MFPRGMVYLTNISVDTLNKGDTEDNNNNNNNNKKKKKKKNNSTHPHPHTHTHNNNKHFCHFLTIVASCIHCNHRSYMTLYRGEKITDYAIYIAVDTMQT
jgi:hypothetical protein